MVKKKGKKKITAVLFPFSFQQEAKKTNKKKTDLAAWFPW